jgi:hypothetical protein
MTSQEELDAQEEEDQARRGEAEMKELANLTNLPPSTPHSQPAAAAKRKVGFTISYLDLTHNATSGSHGLKQ